MIWLRPAPGSRPTDACRHHRSDPNAVCERGPLLISNPRDSSALETRPLKAYLYQRRVLLWLSSKASNPGDLNLTPRELSLIETVVSNTRRPPVKTRSEWI